MPKRGSDADSRIFFDELVSIAASRLKATGVIKLENQWWALIPFGEQNLLPEFVAAFGFANAKAPGFEADDFLAAAVAAEERAGGSALVASGDRDSFQLASPSTSILYPSRGGELARIGPEEVRQRYGVDPKQVPDFIALRGDPSDKLPGAAGVGPKRAAQLVQRYGTLDGVLKAGLFQTQAETLRLYRLIATMDAKAPLPSLADQEPTWSSASDYARNCGLNQLADRLDEKYNLRSHERREFCHPTMERNGRNAQIAVAHRRRAATALI
jgi:5'-3' exonuclease